MDVREILLKQYARHKKAGIVDDLFHRNFWASLPKTATTKKKVDTQWIEPPCVFVGRDPNHPLRGTCKIGVCACDVVVNTAVWSPARQEGGRFARIEYHPDKTWKFAWYDPLFREKRYLYSRDPNQTDRPKFDLARQLWKKHRAVRKEFPDPLLWYFMDTLCIRVGNDKDTRTEADTVGCCTLRAHDHVRFLSTKNKQVHIRFPGKDSVVFDRVVRLPQDAHQTLVTRLRRTPKGQPLFPDITPAIVNRSLQRVLPGCTAKQFRTMRASLLFEKTLRETHDPVLANKKVAELLNHRRNDRTLLLETSRNNYIDPRVYFAYINRHKPQKSPSWFKDAEWAKNTIDFKF
jgi:hypothetical protein